MKNNKGFTLTELIVVIVIIGILAAVLIPNLVSYIDKAKRLSVESNGITVVDNYIASNNGNLIDNLELYNNTYLYYENNYYVVVYNHNIKVSCTKEIPNAYNYNNNDNTKEYMWSNTNLLTGNTITNDTKYLVECVIKIKPVDPQNNYLKSFVDAYNLLSDEDKDDNIAIISSAEEKVYHVSKSYISSYMTTTPPPIASNADCKEYFMLCIMNKKYGEGYTDLEIIKGIFGYKLGSNTYCVVEYDVSTGIVKDNITVGDPLIDGDIQTDYTNYCLEYSSLNK